MEKQNQKTEYELQYDKSDKNVSGQNCKDRVELKKANYQQQRYIKRLYKRAFPAAERKPFWLIEKCRKAGVAEVLVVLLNGKMAGLVITAGAGEQMLIDYLAIDEKYRNIGLGSSVLAAIQMRFAGKMIIFEIEKTDITAANNAQRIRRREFYRRNGLYFSGEIINAFGTELELISYNQQVTFSQYMEMYLKIYPKVADYITLAGNTRIDGSS